MKQKQMQIGETVVTVMPGEDDDGKPRTFLMFEDEDAELSLDLTPEEVDQLIALLRGDA